jgi:DNA-damage-inducible protein J
MSKIETVRARVDAGLKSDAESILSQLGLSTSDAITLFLTQVKLNRGLPFAIRLPNETTNETTNETFQKTDQGKELVHSKDAKEMFKKLGI